MDTMGDEHVAQKVRAEITAWVPRRGANWADLMERVEGKPRRSSHGRLFVYSLSTAALVAVLVLAVIAMSTLDLGPLAGGAVNSTTTTLP